MELKPCPFCGGKTGDSATLCGQNYDGKWWCYNGDYNTRTPDPLAEKVIEAAEVLAVHLRKGGYTGTMFQDALKVVSQYQKAKGIDIESKG